MRTHISRVTEQYVLARELVEMMQSSGHDVTMSDLLDDMASAGVKLKSLTPKDVNVDGTTCVSLAYFKESGLISETAPE